MASVEQPRVAVSRWAYRHREDPHAGWWSVPGRHVTAPMSGPPYPPFRRRNPHRWGWSDRWSGQSPNATTPAAAGPADMEGAGCDPGPYPGPFPGPHPGPTGTMIATPTQPRQHDRDVHEATAAKRRATTTAPRTSRSPPRKQPPARERRDLDPRRPGLSRRTAHNGGPPRCSARMPPPDAHRIQAGPTRHAAADLDAGRGVRRRQRSTEHLTIKCTNGCKIECGRARWNGLNAQDRALDHRPGGASRKKRRPREAPPPRDAAPP